MKSNKLKREPKYIAKFKAFPYQQEAVDAVKDLEYAAIFHEQGLGKTKIAIDVLLYWLSECSMDTALIVTKKQLVANWVNEFVFNEDIIPNTRRDDYEKNSAYKELLSQFTEWANEMSRQIRHRSYERSLTQSDKKFLADESVTDVDGVDISLGTELDSYDMDDSDSVANTDLLSKLSLLMDMGKKKTKYNVLNLNSKFTVDQKQTLEHVFDALYAKYTNAKANDIIQTIIDSF